MNLCIAQVAPTAAASIALICVAAVGICHPSVAAPIGGSARVLPDLVHHSASPSIDVAGAV
jgi:hypothetical protein